MAHVVTERCVDCRYTDCCAVCPVDCFYEIQSPAMLVIDPDTCIDCALCVPECPILAIWPVDELPDAYAEWEPAARVQARCLVADGAWLSAGTELFELEGDAAAIVGGAGRV